MMEAAGVPPLEYFPLLGGHEGAGVVEEVGPGVRSVQPGDRVCVLVHRSVRVLPVVCVGHDISLRQRRDDVGQGDDDGRHHDGVTSATRTSPR